MMMKKWRNHECVFNAKLWNLGVVVARETIKMKNNLLVSLCYQLELDLNFEWLKKNAVEKVYWNHRYYLNGHWKWGN